MAESGSEPRQTLTVLVERQTLGDWCRNGYEKILILAGNPGMELQRNGKIRKVFLKDGIHEIGCERRGTLV